METPAFRVNVTDPPKTYKKPRKTTCSPQRTCSAQRISVFDPKLQDESNRRNELSNSLQRLLLDIVNLPGCFVQGLNAHQAELFIVMGILFVIVTVVIVIALLYK